MTTIAIGLVAILAPFVAYFVLRPRHPKPADDFMPFPLILRGAGGVRQYPILLLLGLVAHLPLLLSIPNWGTGFLDRWYVGLAWTFVAAPLLLQGALAFGALTPLRLRRAGSRAIFVRGLHGMLRATPAAFVVAAGVSLIILLGVWSAQAIRKSSGSTVPDIMIVAAFLVAAVVGSALYFTPAIVVDRKQRVHQGVAGSLDVTFGYRPRIVGIVLGFVMLQALAIAGLIQLLGWMPSASTRPIILLALTIPVGTLFNTWHAVTALIVYHRLRKQKYGGEVDGLLDVFE